MSIAVLGIDLGKKADGWARRQPSTAPSSKYTTRRMATKGGSCARHRPVARRPDDQDPRPHRCPLPPGVLLLTPGNASVVTTAPAVLAEATGRIRRLAADKAYDADWLRADLRGKGFTLIIPGKRGRKRKVRHDKRRYGERWRIETSFNRRKDFRRIATRYDQLTRNYASAVAHAAVVAFWC